MVIAGQNNHPGMLIKNIFFCGEQPLHFRIIFFYGDQSAPRLERSSFLQFPGRSFGVGIVKKTGVEGGNGAQII